MTSSARTVLTRFAYGLTNWSGLRCIVLFSALQLAAFSAPAMAQEGVPGQGLNGWWLFVVILAVLAGGLYVQSSRRRSR